MENKNLALMINMMLFMTHPAVAGEEKEGAFPETLSSSITQSTFFSGEEKVSIDHLNLSTSSAEKSTEISLEKKTVSSERKIFITLPLDHRRKNSSSSKVRKMDSPSILVSPNQAPTFLENQGKNRREEKEPSSSLQGKQKGFPERLPTTFQEDQKEPPRDASPLRLREHYPIDPLKYRTFQVAQQDPPGA